jgi:pimeloyl-ACP methyl ester carboxylesterase
MLDRTSDEKQTNLLELPDGRRLCFAEFGDPDGTPVFLFHGNPNSRLLWGLMPGSPFLPGVRFIAPDRPGFGRTDFVDGVTTVEHWPQDVAYLADSLSIDRFAIFAPSGGGPFGLACAWKLPERLTSVGLFAGVGPLNDETSPDVVRAVRTMWTNAPRLPRLFKLQTRLLAFLARRRPSLYVRLVRSELSEADRETYERLDIASRNQPDRLESYRQGGIGSWYDAMLPANWPVPLEEIDCKVHMWQGELDQSVPSSMSRFIADRIPGAELTMIPGAGHFWVFEHVAEMLEALVAEPQGGALDGRAKGRG